MKEDSSFCSNCGSQLTSEAQFCNKCGTAINRPMPPRHQMQFQAPEESSANTQSISAQPAIAAGQSATSAMKQLFRSANQDSTPSGLLAGAIVFVVTALVAWIGWWPLSIPASLFGNLVSPGSCGQYEPGSLMMYACSAFVASKILIGPIVITLLLVLFRKPIVRGIGKVIAKSKLPIEARFLVAPVIATIFFTCSWSAIHYNSDDGSGLLSQRIFPAVVGLFTFIVFRWEASIQKMLSQFFDLREKIPSFLKILSAILIPLLVSLVITFQERVSATAFKAQIVVLLSVCSGYLLLVPRRGDLLSGLKQVVTKSKTKPDEL